MKATGNGIKLMPTDRGTTLPVSMTLREAPYQFCRVLATRFMGELKVAWGIDGGSAIGLREKSPTENAPFMTTALRTPYPTVLEAV
jgi:hypothetical protein